MTPAGTYNTGWGQGWGLQSAVPASGPFTPAQVAGLAGWWEYNDAATIIFGAPPLIQNWLDKSGNANDWGQTNPARQPEDNAGVFFNRLSRFTGRSMFLPAPITFAGAYSIHFRLFFHSAGTANQAVMARAAGTNYHQFSASSTVQYLVGSAPSDNYVVAAPSTPFFTRHNFSFVTDGAATAELFFNGVSLGSQALTAGGPTQIDHLGNFITFDQALLGKLLNVVVVDGAAGATSRVDIENYMAAQNP